MTDWNPDLYSRFLKDRTQPAYDLAARIAFADGREPKRMIDIGCGPGNSTRVIAERFSGAAVTGADFSEAMLKAARENNPDIEFIRFDATRDFGSLVGKFDVVFSNACIQWLPDHAKVLADMMSVLTDGGVLAVQIPVNYDEPVHRIIHRLIQTDEWRDKLTSQRDFYTLTAPEYFDILSGLTDDFTIWQTTYMHRMPSHESIVDWYHSTGLRPYLDALDEAEAAVFEREFAEEVAKAYPIRKNGEIIFSFPRLFMLAAKHMG